MPMKPRLMVARSSPVSLPSPNAASWRPAFFGGCALLVRLRARRSCSWSLPPTASLVLVQQVGRGPGRTPRAWAGRASRRRRSERSCLRPSRTRRAEPFDSVNRSVLASSRSACSAPYEMTVGHDEDGRPRWPGRRRSGPRPWSFRSMISVLTPTSCARAPGTRPSGSRWRSTGRQTMSRVMHHAARERREAARRS